MKTLWENEKYLIVILATVVVIAYWAGSCG